MTTRSGESSRSSRSTCSSCRHASSPSSRYAASVARPSGGNSEYLIGLQSGLVASVSAGRMNFTRMPDLAKKRDTEVSGHKDHKGHKVKTRTSSVPHLCDLRDLCGPNSPCLRGLTLHVSDANAK